MDRVYAGDIGVVKRTKIVPEPIPMPLFKPQPAKVPVQLPVELPVREREKVPA